MIVFILIIIIIIIIIIESMTLIINDCHHYNSCHLHVYTLSLSQNLKRNQHHNYHNRHHLHSNNNHHHHNNNHYHQNHHHHHQGGFITGLNLATLKVHMATAVGNINKGTPTENGLMFVNFLCLA